MEKVVVLFTKPFGAYAKGDRAGFDAGAAQHLKDLGVAKPDGESKVELGEERQSAVQPAQADAAAEQQLQEPGLEQLPKEEVQQALQATEPQPKPAGKAPKGAKA